MNKFLVLIAVFVGQILSAQIKMEVRILDKKDVYIDKYDKKEPEYLLEIKLINESKENYIIPIDTVGYRTYTSDEKCENFHMVDNFPDVGFMPKILADKGFVEGDGAYLEGRFSTKELKKREKERVRRRNKKEKEIKQWKKRHKIKQNNDYVSKNKYLYKNIKEIKSQETLIYYKKIIPLIINYDLFFKTHDFYLLEKNKKYPMHLEYCIDEGKYHYLTPQQKEKYKGYKFFVGKIISNTVEL